MPSFSLEWFYQTYETDIRELVIRGRPFRFLAPRSLDGFIHPEDVLQDFPLWARIWEASLVLADFLAGEPVKPARQILEIGCGLGVVGIVASAFGHQVTQTEYNPDALHFCRANALLNLPEPDGRLRIEALDWNEPRLEERFDGIIGSEVVYHERDYDPLHRIFQTLLKPSGEIVLAERVRRTSMAFLGQMSRYFEIEARKKVLRREGEEPARIILAIMRPKASS